MINIIGGIALIVLGLLALTLQRLYSFIPAKELKRLARKGDHLAKALYRPVAYGASLRVFLWLIVGVFLSAGSLMLLDHMPIYFDFGFLGALMIISLVWIPSTQLTVHKAQMASVIAPMLVKILFYTHRPLGAVADFVGRYRDLSSHSKLYEKQDLVALLAQQKEQIDNRIRAEEIELAERALVFTDKQAAELVRSRKDVMLVNADDTIGPVLLDQLHKSGQSSFLVYKDKKESIIGSLSLRDAIAAKKDGRVFDLIRNDITYASEDFTLRQVFTALRKTDQYVAVVVNKFEEFVGVITFEDLIRELLGEPEREAVEHYDNRAEVAAYKPKADEPEAELQTEADANDELASPDPTEVVE
jgi:CBS domain containing-hemolysin-like protein